MMGRNHLIAGPAISGASAAVLWSGSDGSRGLGRTLDSWAGHVSVLPAPSLVVSTVFRWFFPLGWGGVGALAYFVAAAALLLLGSLLPDIDSPRSMLGRHVPFPGPHHGIMHTDWLLLALFGVSFWPPVRIVAWLSLGAWIHCELDGFSKAGRVRLYPLGAHKRIRFSDGGECVVPRGFRKGLYRVGTSSETLVLVAVVAMSAVIGSAAVLWAL